MNRAYLEAHDTLNVLCNGPYIENDSSSIEIIDSGSVPRSFPGSEQSQTSGWRNAFAFGLFDLSSRASSKGDQNSYSPFPESKISPSPTASSLSDISDDGEEEAWNGLGIEMKQRNIHEKNSRELLRSASNSSELLNSIPQTKDIDAPAFVSKIECDDDNCRMIAAAEPAQVYGHPRQWPANSTACWHTALDRPATALFFTDVCASVMSTALHARKVFESSTSMITGRLKRKTYESVVCRSSSFLSAEIPGLYDTDSHSELLNVLEDVYMCLSDEAKAEMRELCSKFEGNRQTFSKNLSEKDSTLRSHLTSFLGLYGLGAIVSSVIAIFLFTRRHATR
jgi:hypothetical protein